MKNHFAALAFALVPLAASAGCGTAPDACAMPDGEYHLLLPSEAEEQGPAVVFLHGAGGSGGATIGNSGLTEPLLARGYVVIAPTGSRSFEGRPGSSWNFFPGWDGRDETGFLKRVVADAAERFGVDPGRTLLAGFSAGAFEVTYLACADPEAFPAYAPVSGGFWKPHPASCAGPVKLLQTHGWRDPVVPLEGRPLRGGQFLQGDIFAGMDIWRAANGCARPDPASFSETGEFWRRVWQNCAPGSALEFALFPGGHMVPPGWADMALDWFETVTYGAGE